MKEVDQSSLHPLIKHPETDMAQPGIEPRPIASQALYLTIRNRWTDCNF
jgi:hypothetical protein